MGAGISAAGYCGIGIERIGEGTVKEKLLKTIIAFFIIMTGCTFMARGADSITVPKVKTMHEKKGELTEKFEGTGEIVSQSQDTIAIPENQRILDILVQPGMEVEVGAPLVSLDVTYLDEQILKKQREIEKVQLQLEQKRIEGEGESRLPQTSEAEIDMEAARDAYVQTQQNYQKAVDAFQVYADAHSDGNEEEQQEARQKKEELQAQIDAREEAMDTANLAYQQSIRSYHLAEQQEAQIQKDEKNKKRENDLSLQEIQLELDSLNDELTKLIAIKDGGALVKADRKGIMAVTDLTEGFITTGNEKLVLYTEELEAYGMIPEEKIGKVEQGDEVTVRISGHAETIPLKIDRIVQKQEEDKLQTVWYAPLDKGIYRMGTTLTYEYKKKIETSYDSMVPLTALRESEGNSYVLIAEKKPGILGNSYTAVRVAAVLLDKDEENAALQIHLPEDAKIITESNKYIKEGDRVRLIE